jgi:hypothetical protein
MSLDESDSGAPAEGTAPVRLPGVLVVALLAVAALLAKDSAIDRWLNQRLGTSSPTGLGMDDVGRGLAELTPETVQYPAPEVPAKATAVDDAGTGEVREEQLQYLRDVRDDINREITRQERKLERYDAYDLLVIRSRLVAGAFTLVLAVCCVLLVVAGYLPLGLVSGALALIPGTGTIGLTRVTQLLEKRMKSERTSLGKNRETVRSVTALLTLRNPAILDAEMVKLSQKFAAEPGNVDADRTD